MLWKSLALFLASFSILCLFFSICFRSRWLLLFVICETKVKRLVTSATHHNDIPSLKDALEVSVEMYKKDFNNVSDYIQRHLLSQSIWEDPGYASYFS